MEQLTELLQFLHDKNPQVRQLALSNLLPHTAADAPHRNIFFPSSSATGLQKPKESDVLRDLKLLCRDQLAVAHDAFRALVNLSDSPLVITSLSDPQFLLFLVSYIIHPSSICADLAAMLLSNLSSSAAPCASLLSLTVQVLPVDNLPSKCYPTQSRSGTCLAPVPYPQGEPQDLLSLPLLIDAFIQASPPNAQLDEDPSSRQRKSDLHFLASVFANLASSPAGRSFFLSPRPSVELNKDSPLEYPLAKLVAFTEHPNRIRRSGVIATIKNCAFDDAGHKTMLTPDDETINDAPGVGVVPYLLLPLAGPDEFDLEDQEKLPEALQLLPPSKQRESDPNIRLAILEAFLILCHTRHGRDFQRNNGVYEIIRAAHRVEKEDKISDHIERLVNLLKREEGPGLKDTSERSVELAKEKEEDSDDEDCRIEEI